MKYRAGFTVIEVLVVLLFLIIALAIFLTQKASVDSAVRDSERKSAVNAIYYNLEEVYYKKTGYYPEFIDNSTLTALDPDLLTDPNGNVIGSPNSTIIYESNSCSLDGKCQGYSLRAELENEAEYRKSNTDYDLDL